MRKSLRILTIAAVSGVIGLCLVGCPKSETTKNEKDAAASKKKPEKIRVEEKYGVTSEGLGG